MCGIIAITGNKTGSITDKSVLDILDTLSKRGPDDQDFLRFSNCILGQTRLSIVDIAGGHQPMKDNSRNITVTFNGEIYNYKELRKELELKGHIFSTNSDTEAILKAYIEYGEMCPKYLDGMFAFVVWNDDTKELFFARDRFGKKPLYYSFDGDENLVIASEIKAIMKAGIKGIIDPIAIDDYLMLMYIPPWKTVYKNIHVIPPAHSGIIKNGKISISKYWQIENKPIKVSYGEAKKEIIRLFNDAVKKRMVADVEIGALLSGGVDSTLVCAYAQKYSSHPLKTFSVGYEGLASELPFAKLASDKIGTDHYTLEPKVELIEELRKVIGYMDEPHADSSNFPQHLISNLASTKVKVALSGDGADEIFMGYGWYWKYWHTSKLTRVKNVIFSDQFKEYLKDISIFQKKDRIKLWKDPSCIAKDISQNARESRNLIEDCASNNLQKINNFDLYAYLPGQLLTKVDRTSMMHSLEIRCPFLDYKLVEYVYNIPVEYKMDRKQGKIILKDILADIFTKEFVYRRKQGFGAPIKDWLRRDDFRKLISLTLNSKAEINNLLDNGEIKKIITLFYSGDDSIAYKLWTLLCLELWFDSQKCNT